MNQNKASVNRTAITIETVILMGGLLVLLSLLARFLLGPAGLYLGPLCLIVFLVIESRAPAVWFLRAQGAVPVPGYHPIARLFRGLCDRAGLDHRVRLYYAPANRFNAFTTGHGEDSVVVLNRPILEHFSNGEIAGILAHELGHVANNDIRFMAMAGALTTMISQLAFILLIVAVVMAPAMLFQGSIGSLFIMILAAVLLPYVALYLQAKLSRTREFAADLAAAELLDGPDELIRALVKLEQYSSGFMFPWFRRGNGYFHTHPNTIERVERLRSFRAENRTFESGLFPVYLKNPEPGYRRSGKG